MAVYTRLTRRQFEEVAAQFGLGAFVAAREIAEGVENSNYVFVTRRSEQAETRHILTLFEKRVDTADLPFFLGITEHLSRRGVPCPCPLRTHGGEYAHPVAGKMAAVVSFLEGASPRRIEVPHLLSLGAMQARMHLAAAGFPLSRRNDLALGGWGTLLRDIGDRADGIAPGLAEALRREYAFLASRWPRDLPSGVIHADVFPDNVFFTGGEISGIIDFYFACNDLFMYDLVIAMNAWCFERDGAFNLTKARALLTAYHRVRPLCGEERDALPVLARGAALRFLLTRAFDWLHRSPEALVTPKDPLEYLKKLRFHQQVNTVSEYGL